MEAAVPPTISIFWRLSSVPKRKSQGSIYGIAAVFLGQHGVLHAVCQFATYGAAFDIGGRGVKIFALRYSGLPL
jgi:hypothetical protein